ncbi:hypothetical protein ACOMHN_024424 [Nucella lapillus]
MEFHPDKCSVLTVQRSRKPTPEVAYTLHGQQLEHVSSTKYLGVTIQSDGKWDQHITSIANKANRTLGFLRRNLKIGSRRIKQMAYKVLVRPVLEYSACVWDPHDQNDCESLEKVQRRTARFALNRHRRTSSVEQMMHELKWTHLEQRRRTARLCMLYKIMNELVCVRCKQLAPAVTRSRRCHNKQLMRIPAKNEYRNMAFFPRTVRDWNGLPADAVLSPSLGTFSSKERNVIPESAPDNPAPSIKREIKSARQSSSDEEQVETKEALHAEIKARKRSLSSSESGDNSVPVSKAPKSRSDSRERKKHKKKKKKHKHKEDKRKKQHEGSTDRKQDKDSEEFWKNQTSKTFLQEIPGLTPEFAFRLDRKAEKSLWNYESVYKGYIARYRRATDKCLGNSSVQLSGKKEKIKAPSFRYYSKDNRKEIRKKGQTVPVDKRVEKKTAEYISVKEKDDGRQRSSGLVQTNPLGVLDDATSLYVQGKALATSEENGEQPVVDEMLERTAFYNRRLQEDPGNVKLWMEFVSFQDQVFQDDRFSTESVAKRRMRETFQPPRSCIEKKLAITDKALKANPSSLDLKLLKLEIEQDVSDSSALAKEWDDLLFVYAGDVRLWRHYLSFQQSRLATFTVGRVVKLYHRCFRTLIPILEDRVQVLKKSETMEEDLMGSTDEEEEQILQQDRPVWHTWLKMERLRQGVHWLPWRPDTDKGETEDDCEDLDRLVLYEDVAPVLLRLHRSASLSRLVRSFLDLLGLVQGERGGDGGGLHFRQFALTSLWQIPSASVIAVNIGVDSSWQPRAEVVTFVEEVLRQSAAYFSSYQRTGLNRQLLRLQTEKHGRRDVTALSERAAKEVRRFGKGLLKEVQNRNDLLLWDAYIRSEWAFGKFKDATSMLHTALTMFTTTAAGDDHAEMTGLFALYRTLAEIYLNFTPLELATLPGRKSSPPEAKNKVLSSYACLLERSQFRVPKGEAAPSAQTLRTRRKFQSMVADLLGDAASLSADSSATQHAVLLVNCFALFELCACGITEAVEVFDSALQVCTAASQKDNPPPVKLMYSELEKDLHQTLLSLLKNHTAVNVVSTSSFRSHLDRALSRFPNCAQFLCQFVEVELRTFMAWRLRRFFEAAGQDPVTVFPMLCAVLAELGRHAKLMAARRDQGQGEGVSDCGTVHRMRAACERGLGCKAAQHCPLLWRLYLAFEAQYGSLDRAKGVFYRALQSCPWAKVLYMDGAALFGAEQVQELVDLMTEKELRVQIPLEEVHLLLNSEPQGPEEGDTQEDQEEASDAS